MESVKKLLDPKNDLVFHAIFRQKNNKLTEAFISSVLNEDVKDIMTRNKDIREAKEELETLNGDYEIQRLAELSEKAIRDEAAALDFDTKKVLSQDMKKACNKAWKKEWKKDL